MDKDWEEIRLTNPVRVYRNPRYDMLRRLKCCTVCKTRDKRTEAGGALCARCLQKKREKAAKREAK